MRLTHAVTRETIFRAKSKKQPLGEQMNLPVREAQSATSSLPYGNGYALGKFTSLLLSIYLVSRSTDPFTRLSVIFRPPLSLFPSRSTFNPLCSASSLAKSQVVRESTSFRLPSHALLHSYPHQTSFRGKM